MSTFKKGQENERADDIDLSLRRMPRSSEERPPRAKYRRVEMNPISHMHMGERVFSETIINGQPIPGGSPAQDPGPTVFSLSEPNPQLWNSMVVIDDSSNVNVAEDSGFAGVFDPAEPNVSQMPRGPEDGPSRVEVNLFSSVEMRPEFLDSDVVRTGVQDSSESHVNGQPIPGGSPAQDPGPSVFSLSEPNPQLWNSMMVIDDSSNVNVAEDSGFAPDFDTAEPNVSQMPRGPEDGPSRVEVNPSSSVGMRPEFLDSDVVRTGVQDSSESHVNGQPIPGGSPAQDPGPSVFSLSEPNPQLWNSMMVIDDSSNVNVAEDSGFAPDFDTAEPNVSQMPRGPEDGPSRVEVNPSSSVGMRPEFLDSDVERTGVQDSSESHVNGQPIPGGSPAQEPSPQSLNSVIIIDDSSDEDVAASSSIRFSESRLQGNSTPRIFTRKKNRPPQQITENYFFERLGFRMSDFLKDNFVENLKQKFARQQKESEKRRSVLLKQIEAAQSARKAHDRAMLERISQFRFAKCPVYLFDYLEEELMPLTSIHLQLYNELIQGSPHEVLSFKFKYFIRRSDILTLVGSNWLNDNVINFYMTLLTKRSEQREGELPSVYAMNTFFLERLTLSGYAGVSRWTRKVDLFKKDIIPVPVHYEGNHWCMAIIHMRDKTIRYYDSMGQRNQPVLDALETYLKEESLQKRNTPFDTSDFKIENVLDVPRQTNSYDCGVFSCMFAEYITRDATINFSQRNTTYFRKKMVLEIANGRLWN